MKKTMLTGNLLYLIFLFLVLLAYVNRIFNPMMTETTELDKQHIINRMQIDLLADQKVKQAELEKTVEDLKNKVNTVVDFESGEVISDRLSAGAAASGLMITSRSVYPQSDEGSVNNVIPLAKITAEVEFSGNYSNFLSFVSYLEKSEKDAFYIENASMDSESNTGRISVAMYNANKTRGRKIDMIKLFIRFSAFRPIGFRFDFISTSG